MGRSRNRKKPLKFEYTPLKPGHIRVLQLQPGRRSHRLRGYFKVVSLDDEAFSRPFSPYDLRWGDEYSLDFFGEPKFALDDESGCVFYDALSYVWGDPTPVDTVLISDNLLPIAANLATALRYLRYTKRPLSIWCDAICINQNDLDERAQQVQLMRRVYQQADCVRIWINEPSVDGKSAAVSALKDYYKASDNPSEGLGPDLNFWSPLVPIFRNPYWNRVWIQQEVLNARQIELHCINIVIPGRSVAKFQDGCFMLRMNSKKCWRKLNLLQPYSSFASNDLSLYGGGTKIGSLLQVIEGCWNLDMTDGKDRVYAMMHLAEDYEDGGIVVDYSKSEVEVMADAIEYHMRRNQTLEFLNDAFLESKNTLSFFQREQRQIPTWLPRLWLGIEEFGNSVSFTQDREMHTKSSSCFVQGNQLQVRGFKVDQIKQRLTSVTHFRYIRLKDFCDSPFGIYLQDYTGVSVKALSHELYSILTYGPDHLIRPTHDAVVSGLLVLFALARDVRHAERNIGFEAEDIEDLLEGMDCTARRALQRIFSALSRRMVMTTENKHLGLIPACDVMGGDEVWILLGCKCPVVLRPKNGVYWHVCTAYMPKLLDHPDIRNLSNDVQPGDKVGDWTVTDIVLE